MNRLDYLKNLDADLELKLEPFSYTRELAKIFRTYAINRIGIRALWMNSDVFNKLKKEPGINDMLKLDSDDGTPSYAGKMWGAEVFIYEKIGPNSILFKLNNHADVVEDWSQVIND